MPISVENVKLMASQRLTDTEDGGGQMTGNEVVDGNINNLFPDISRLDRVYGRVSLRKAFVSVMTADNDTYNGSHVILSVPAEDPRVSVCLFTTDDPHDERDSAVNRLESYVTRGPRYNGWLWGPQLAGSRQIAVFQPKGAPLPEIGDVLFLIKNEGLSTEQSQYVRITKVEAEDRTFGSTSGSTSSSFSRSIVYISIGDPLRDTYAGIEISNNDALPTSIYTTVIADAAKYYGVMKPTVEISANDISLNVDSIYTHLVPSAQGETPVVDVSPGEAGPVMGSGTAYTITTPSTTWSNGSQLHFCRGIKPTTLTISGSGRTFTEAGDGILLEGVTQRGTVDYSTGDITFTNVTSFSAAFSATAVIGAALSRVPNTHYIEVTISNRGYNFTAILDPQPVRKTLTVDFMAQGKWYRLRDDGKGYLVPDVADTGAGTINYTTGSVAVTCGALPDVETAIMFAWGAPIESEDISGVITVPVAQLSKTVANPPIKPGSLSISWPSGAGTAVATDNGSGTITGAATGSVNYATGLVVWKPTSIPASGSVYTIDYDHYPRLMGSLSGGGGLTWNATIPGAPLKPRTVEITTTINVAGINQLFTFHDNGAGGISAGGFSLDYPINNEDWDGSTTINGVSGTIDYVTGNVQVNLTGVAGSYTYIEPYIMDYYTAPVVSIHFSNNVNYPGQG